MRDGELPFKEGTIPWALMSDDFSDLTVNQIAEVLGTYPGYIRMSMRRIYDKTGIRIKYTAVNHRGEATRVTEFGGG